jgi:glutamate dehydrogenase
VPEDLARRIAWLPVEGAIPDIVIVAEETEADLDKAAVAYFDVAHHFRLGAMSELAGDLEVHDYYDGLALDRARATLASAHRAIAISAIQADGFAQLAGERSRSVVNRTTQAVAEILDGGLSVSKFSVAASLLAEISDPT